jgi:hypothetical protein
MICSASRMLSVLYAEFYVRGVWYILRAAYAECIYRVFHALSVAYAGCFIW